MGRKRVFLIWDFDAAIGAINSTYPYNFSIEYIYREIENVRKILDLLDLYGIKSCFAITGFSAETGIYPFNIPDLIREIYERGHEVASHSWRHEWIPLFDKKQIEASLRRSKKALESALGIKDSVTGFVPPHSRPMTWLKRGAFSLGDKRHAPFYPMGDFSAVLSLVQKTGYKWARVSHHKIWHKFYDKTNLCGRVIKHNGILILENHHVGFDQVVISHITSSNGGDFIITAHPAMLLFPDKNENIENLTNFLDNLSRNVSIQFCTPRELIIAK